MTIGATTAATSTFTAMTASSVAASSITASSVAATSVTATSQVQGGTANGYLDLAGDSDAVAKLRVTDTGEMSLNHGTDNGRMTVGLTINQGTDTGEILSLKKATAQGFSKVTETDTFMMFKQFYGAAAIWGFADPGNPRALQLHGASNAADTSKGPNASSLFELRGFGQSGGNLANVPADGNLVGYRNNASMVWLADAEGDSWQTGGADFNGAVDLNTNSLENVGNANTNITGTGADFGVPINSTYTADDYWTLTKSDSGPWASQVFGTHSTGTSTPVAFIDVSVPNPGSTTQNTYASIVIDYMVNSNHVGGGGNKVYTGQAISVIERGGDTDADLSTVTKLISEVAAGSGAETIDISFDYSAVTGATTGTQTFSIRVAADSTENQPGHIVYDAKVITYNTQHAESGLKVSIAPSS